MLNRNSERLNPASSITNIAICWEAGMSRVAMSPVMRAAPTMPTGESGSRGPSPTGEAPKKMEYKAGWAKPKIKPSVPKPAKARPAGPRKSKPSARGPKARSGPPSGRGR